MAFIICLMFPGILWDFSFSAVIEKYVCLSSRDVYKTIFIRSF